MAKQKIHRGDEEEMDSFKSTYLRLLSSGPEYFER